MPGKQARIVDNDAAVKRMVDYVEANHRYPHRDRVIVLLSFKAGMRRMEIAGLLRRMVMNAEGIVDTVIHLENSIAKKGAGRIVPINPELREAIIELMRVVPGRPSDPLILSERAMRENEDEPGTASIQPMLAGSIGYWFYKLYKASGLYGCSSHSGRRTFITRGGRRIGQVGGSLRDVQYLAGHKSLSTTQGYIDTDTVAQRKLVDIV
jgi:integrase/recombinase XerD